MKIRKPQFLVQALRDAQLRVKKKFKKQIDIPWMKTKELDILSELLIKLQPAYCFEWGSGYSTIYFPKHLKALKLWFALEHHQEWFNYISAKNVDERVKIKFIPPTNFTSLKSKGYSIQKEGAYEQFKDYVDFPSTLGVTFDFMFIDGRARTACLREAFNLISDNGIVVVHDANRENYMIDLPPFNHVIRFKDYHPFGGGIWIASKNRDLKTVLNIQDHLIAWRRHAILDTLLLKDFGQKRA